jgi:DNA-binding LacI/PurR family transcriptional regulator
MPTIKDVAKEAGVSIATVSYVLNNRNDMVSEKTRVHVMETARQLGYRANIIAKNLQSSRTNLLGYAWHTNPIDQPNLVMAQFIYHLAQAAEAQQYHLLTFTHPNDEPSAVYDELIRSGRVDGFLLAETVTDDPRVRYLMQKDFPFVSFGRANPKWDTDYHWIDTDGKAGMYDGTCYLIDEGHERIAFLGWPQDSLSGNYRLSGYQAAMTDACLPMPDDYIIYNDYAKNSIENAFTHWATLPTKQHPTAIIAVADYVAVAAMRIAEQFGFEIGKTLSIVGFDDAPFVRYLQPGLTTLQQPLPEIAKTMVEMIDLLIAGEVPEQSQRLFAPRLVIRGSSGAPVNE